MAQLRQDHEEFLDRDAIILIVGPEDQRKFKDYWDSEDLPFIGLPDPTHKVLKLFGQKVNIFKFGCDCSVHLRQKRYGPLRALWEIHAGYSRKPGTASLTRLFERKCLIHWGR